MRKSSHWISLADQAVVSGSNFVVSILLARLLGLESFGVYVIATTFLLYSNTFQTALIISPMMTAVVHETDEAQRNALLSGFFGCALLLSVVIVVCVVLITVILGSQVATLQLGANTGPLALAILGFQSQDWLRRALYAQQKFGWTLLLDVLAYGGQIAGLTVLSIEQLLTTTTALICMASVFFMAMLLIAIPQRIIPRRRQIIWVARTYWRASRDFFIAGQLQWAGAEGVLLFGAGVLGQAVAGAIRATQNLLGPVVVVFQWMDNIMPVQAVIYLKQGGKPAMYQFLARISWLGICLFGIFVFGLYFVAEPLIVILYGEAYRSYWFLVVLQGLYLLMGHLYRMEIYACRALDKTKELARSSLIWFLSSTGLAIGIVPIFAENAIIIALIFGISAAYAYLLILRKKSNLRFR